MHQTDQDRQFMRAAYGQALASYNEGGLPIGAVMAELGVMIAAGHNRRVQEGDLHDVRRDDSAVWNRESCRG
jgi:creatinine deaminase